MQEKLVKILHNFLDFSADTEGSVFIENLKSGHINDTFKVVVNAQNFILQRVNTAIFPEPLKIMENIETVANHLKSKDYERSILAFVKTKDNTSIHFDGGDAWRLMPFVDNTYSPNASAATKAWFSFSTFKIEYVFSIKGIKRQAS